MLRTYVLMVRCFGFLLGERHRPLGLDREALKGIHVILIFGFETCGNRLDEFGRSDRPAGKPRGRRLWLLLPAGSDR